MDERNYNEIKENGEGAINNSEQADNAVNEAVNPPVDESVTWHCGTSEQPTVPEMPAPQPQNGRYVYFSDGTRRFVSNTPPPVVEPPKKKKSKVGVIAASVTVGVVLVCLICVLGLFGIVKLLQYNSSNNVLQQAPSSTPVTEESNIVLDNSETDEDLSVPEIVDVVPVPENDFESLVALYNECAKSCVTILCDVQINNGFFTQEGQSLGSGFIIEGTKDGEKGLYIVTNHHVVDDAKAIRVKYHDGEIFEATLLGSDELTDIAVLKTERTDVTPIEMGDSSQLSVGQWVVAIGTPSDEVLQNTMSYGIISGLSRKIEVTNDSGTTVKTMTVIQTTATLNPGNSGGPLINMAGQVVGINAMKMMEDYEGIGFALPSTEAAEIISSLIEYGKYVGSGGFVSSTAQLGIQGATVTEEVRQAYSLGNECPTGVLVVNVSRGTSVYEAGLSVFDIITEFNGVRVETMEELKEEISKCNAGDKVTMKFYRLARAGQSANYYTISFKLDNAQ